MGLGRCYIADKDIAINQDLKALFIDEKQVNNKFLLYSYSDKRELIESLGSGTTVKGITLGTLRNLDFLLPPLPTQKRIASILGAF
jgi:type I restriction enzyme S subunit